MHSEVYVIMTKSWEFSAIRKVIIASAQKDEISYEAKVAGIASFIPSFIRSIMQVTALPSIYLIQYD